MMKKLWSKSYIGLILFLLYLPIFVVILFSFNSEKMQTVFKGFSFRYYGNLFTNRYFAPYLFNTIQVAVTSAITATVLGTAAALGLSRLGRRGKKVFMNLTYIPVINPDVVTGVSLSLVFSLGAVMFGLPKGFWTVLIAHITFGVPFVVLNVLPRIKGADKDLMNAAHDLGCNNTQAFFKVLLPEIMPGVFSGFLMAFSLSLDDYMVATFVSGPSFQTLPLKIYSEIKKPLSPEYNAFFTLVFGAVFLVLLVSNIINNKGKVKK